MKLLVFLAAVTLAYAAPDRRPQQGYGPPPAPVYRTYSAPKPVRVYAPAPAPTYRRDDSGERVYSSYAAQPQRVVAILNQDFKMNDDGYNFNFETEDYQTRKETAQVIPGTGYRKGAYGSEEDDGSIRVQGEAYWVSPEGIPITLRYAADENGYQPQGDHLPVAPEVTPEVAQATAEHLAAVAEAQSRSSYGRQQGYAQPVPSYAAPTYAAPSRPRY